MSAADTSRETVEEEDENEHRPLLSESQPLSTSQRTAATIEVSPLLKLKCFIYALLLIVLGFVVTIVETQTFLDVCSKLQAHDTIRPVVDWVCYSAKCAYLLPAIAALLYLQRRVIVQGKVPLVELQLHKNRSEATNGPVLLRNVSSYVQLPSRLSSSPSMPFIITSLLFSFFSCLSIVIEIACGVIQSTKGVEYLARQCPDILRRMLLLIFIVIQTRFFVLHHRVSVQWKLGVAWFCAVHILATNIASWFINVGFEVREVVNSTARQIQRDLYCTNTSIDSVVRALYPFLIEYYVMSALMVFAFMANMGMLAGAMTKTASSGALTTDSIRAMLQSSRWHTTITQNWRAEGQMLRNFTGTVGCGIFSVLIALAAAVFIKLQGKDMIRSQVTFYFNEILLYSCCMACNGLLLQALETSRSSQHLSGIHSTDRALLWLGTLAIAVNDVYTFWVSWTKIPKDDKDQGLAVLDVLIAISSAFNVCQSLLQVYTLECALMYKLSSARSQYGRALLTVLMLLNAAQWLVNTICFDFFFPNNKMDAALVMSLLTIPLQVFFRFHSIACIHDFKKHCDEDHGQQFQQIQQEGASSQAMVDFPNDVNQ